MNKKNLIIIVVAAVVIIAGGAVYGFIGRKTAENVAENAIEKATNGQADVDYDSDTISVNTNGGSFQAGENVSLPSGFPSDVYVIDGDLKAAIKSGNDSYNLTIETSAGPAEANTIYEREIAADGWTVSGTANYNGVYSIMAQKGDRYLTFGASTSDGINAVILTVYSQAAPDATAPADY